jgi:hypothetical protein
MMPRQRSRFPLWVVLAAVVVLQIAGAAYYGMATRRRMVMHAHALLAMRHLQEALVQYGADHTDQCPRSMSVLVEYGYLDRQVRDDWGTALAFTCTSPFSTDNPLVVSAGPDRRFDTPDDLRTDRRE